MAHSPIKYESFLKRSIWPIEGTLTCTTILQTSGPGSNANEWDTLHSSDLESYNQMQFSVKHKMLLFEVGLTPLQEIPSVYSKPWWQDWQTTWGEGGIKKLKKQLSVILEL